MISPLILVKKPQPDLLGRCTELPVHTKLLCQFANIFICQLEVLQFSLTIVLLNVMMTEWKILGLYYLKSLLRVR